MLKNHSCALTSADAGSSVILAGWVHRRRDHGGVIFIDLRDRDGLVQVVFSPEKTPVCYELAKELRNEYVIQVTGPVNLRPPGTENEKMASGQVEVTGEGMSILNASRTPPFYINEEAEIDENLRLKYRYLDLRRERMKDNLILRHRVVSYMREFLNARGFIEVETPILIKSTPEGARDYLVPSRVFPGKFFALPQSPQQLKQLLMVAGVERYYQIARCFRDEDLRADRQPEFTQLDLEMSFVEEEDLIRLMEELFTGLVETVKPEMHFAKPFPRFTLAEATERFGCDKPDLRFGMELADISDIAGASGFGVFTRVVSGGGAVKAIAAPGCAAYTKHQIDDLNQLAVKLGAGGLVTIGLGSGAADLDGLTAESVKSIAAKYLTIEQIKAMAARCSARPGDLMLVIAGDRPLVNRVLGELRCEMARKLSLAKPGELAFAFVTGFPLFDWSKEMGRWDSVHHPFTAPKTEDIPLLETDPGKVGSRAYDVVCNGYEIAGGSIRIHIADLQRRVFHLLGYDDAQINDRFGHLLEAFEYGAPPHGGVAPGIDRIVMILAGEPTIREVIPFPKNQSAADLLFGAPSEVTPEQLAELHISLSLDQE